MRRIEYTSAFRRDFKREKKGRHRGDVDSLVSEAVGLLSQDNSLAARTRDHELSGEWRDHRECHLRPDLLLIYRKPDSYVLQLV
ncbi:MAG: type II toxin-antitoxin system YafQ family toxin [Candidatus Sulfotelmatobacter sp.]